MEDVMTATAVQAQLAALKQRSIAERLALLRRTFPDVVADAETFLSYFWGMPYELVLIEPDDPYAAVVARYDIGFQRHRPSPDQISPRTDLLYDACELLMAHQPDRDMLLAALQRRHQPRD